MSYSIKEVSEMTGLPPSTLRYYEKEGLIPTIGRNESGVRMYTDEDLEWISIITCLKNTDMPIKEIKAFVKLCALGDDSLEERRQIVLNHKRNVEAKIVKLQYHLKHIHYKADYYEAACKAGKEKELKKQKYPNPFQKV